MAVSIHICRDLQLHFHMHGIMTWIDLSFQWEITQNAKSQWSLGGLPEPNYRRSFPRSRIDTSTFLSYDMWSCKLTLLRSSRARSARSWAPWVRNFSYLPIRENLVMTSAYSVRSYTLWGWGKGITSDSPSGEEYVLAEVKFFISSTSLVSAVNHMVARAFKGKKNRVFVSTKF